ncbi:hypothetical protein [Serratia marcescens]|uniref:hypothetical protein n=1 Tax=Serratia marcescens TaxID=615 RepID=UPI0039833B84
MIASIYEDAVLSDFISNEIKENGSCVDISEDYYSDGVLINDLIANVKVDDFYNSLRMNPTPPSVDNLVVVKGRGENRFELYIIELKDVKKMASLDTVNLVSKFRTTFEDFMSQRYGEIFLNEGIIISHINLWIVCNRFRGPFNAQMDEDKFKRRVKNTAMEALLLTKPFHFRKKLIPIQLKFNEYCEIQ